jgi:hypothetical protein
VNDIKKLRFLLKKGFLFKDFERGINDAIFSNYSDFKIYAVHEVSEKKQINKNKLMSKQKLLTQEEETTNC